MGVLAPVILVNVSRIVDPEERGIILAAERHSNLYLALLVVLLM